MIDVAGEIENLKRHPITMPPALSDDVLAVLAIGDQLYSDLAVAFHYGQLAFQPKPIKFPPLSVYGWDHENR